MHCNLWHLHGAHRLAWSMAHGCWRDAGWNGCCCCCALFEVRQGSWAANAVGAICQWCVSVKSARCVASREVMPSNHREQPVDSCYFGDASVGVLERLKGIGACARRLLNGARRARARTTRIARGGGDWVPCAFVIAAWSARRPLVS